MSNLDADAALLASLALILAAINSNGSATVAAINAATTAIQTLDTTVKSESQKIQDKLQATQDFLDTEMNTYDGYGSKKDDYTEKVKEGDPENKEKLRASTSNIHRIREIFEVQMDMGPLTSGPEAGGAAAPLQKLLIEFQTKKDANGDGKVYGWDFVFTEPPPMLASVRKQEGAEEIAGPPTEDGKYPS